MQPGYFPALRFKPEGHKALRAELILCAPEFAEMLEQVPEEERFGRVFKLQSSGWHVGRYSDKHAGQIISKIGRAAGVVVDEATDKAASAHDYRRAFGTRWAKRILPPALKQGHQHNAEILCRQRCGGPGSRAVCRCSAAKW